MRLRITAAAILLSLTCVTDPAAAQGYQSGFFAQVYAPTRQPQRYARVASWFQSSGYLTYVANWLNQRYAIPGSVQVAAAECGQANAFFRPRTNPPSVVMCYELVDAIYDAFQRNRLTGEQLDTALRGTLDFIMYHEIGHALVGVLDLPITGREEDVADQFATLVLAYHNPNSTVWAAQFFGLQGFRQGPMSATVFADEHALNEQRFYNILCWTYGMSPANRASLLRSIPRDRAVRCPDEYRRLATSLNTLLARHERTATPQYSTTPARPRAQSTSWLAGQWRYGEQIVQPSDGMTCDDTGTIVLQGGGGSYVQTGTCTLNGQRFDNPGRGALTNVSVDGTTVRFRMETCDYAGTLVRSSPARIEGSLFCVTNNNGTLVEARGTWAAER
jgi:hypothetical protein